MIFPVFLVSLLFHIHDDIYTFLQNCCTLFQSLRKRALLRSLWLWRFRKSSNFFPHVMNDDDNDGVIVFFRVICYFFANCFSFNLICFSDRTTNMLFSSSNLYIEDQVSIVKYQFGGIRP